MVSETVEAGRFDAGAFSLEGRLALVTGAGQGNGRAIALGLAQAGADVIVVDRDPDSAEAVAAEIKALGRRSWSRQVDVSDAAACTSLAEQTAREHDPVSILVNNAGILLRGAISDQGAAENWSRTLAVNLDGPFNMVRAFLPALRQTHGTVINIGSIQSFVATPNSAAYTASKGAILQLTKALALELAPLGIRVNGIAPGFMDTPMTVSTQSDPDKMAALLRHVPLARVGRPEELVGGVVFLASDAASYVTGTMLPIDGGYLAM